MIEIFNLFKSIQINDHENGRYLYIVNFSILEFDINEYFLNLDDKLKQSIAFIETNESMTKNHNLSYNFYFNHLEKSLIYNAIEKIPENKKHIISLTNIKNLDFFLKKIHNFITCPSNKLIYIGNPLDHINLKYKNKISFHQTFTTQTLYIEYFLSEYDQIFGKLFYSADSLTLSFKKSFLPWKINSHLTVKGLVKARNKHSFKNSFGHSAIFGGSRGMIGAIILASKAALKSGCGLVTAIVPQIGLDPLQSSIPEVMVVVSGLNQLSALELPNLKAFDAIGIGCGMSYLEEFENILKKIASSGIPIVIDADGLNCLAKINNFEDFLPPKTILTPHVGEFDRLFGKSKNTKSRLKIAAKFVEKNDVIIVLKGAHTCIIAKGEPLTFNTTGNDGMATAGSGDTLTGIITSLLAQGYKQYDAAVLGVYLHGLAADIAIQSSESKESLIASDIAQYLGRAFKKLSNDN